MLTVVDPPRIWIEKSRGDKPCPHCGRPVVLHGWPYSEVDEFGRPVARLEIYEHQDGSLHELHRERGTLIVEFRSQIDLR